MNVPARVLTTLVVLALTASSVPVPASAQSDGQSDPGDWWAWAAPIVMEGEVVVTSRGWEVEVEARSEDRDRRRPRTRREGPPPRERKKGPHRKKASVHVPPGHRPPPGACRLWYIGTPPGQQPPPVSCSRIGRVPRGAVVVTHDGIATPPPRPQRRRPRSEGAQASLEVHWEQGSFDVVFRGRTEHRRRLRETELEAVIGRSTLRQIAAAGGQASAGPLHGRWLQRDREARVLQVRAGSRPLAEMTDYDGDDRADVVLVRALQSRPAKGRGSRR